MVICGVLVDETQEKELKKIGVKDSKLLSPKQRSDLSFKIKKIAKDFKIILVQPKEIDQALDSDESNLNLLEADKFAEIIDSLKPDIAYVDCPSTNTKKFKNYLMGKLKRKDVKLVVEHKADKNYVTAGAASILAKVTRDTEIERLKRKYKIDFGSGYPADPFTKQFLVENYKKYPIFRKSWSSWKNIARKNGQKKLNNF